MEHYSRAKLFVSVIGYAWWQLVCLTFIKSPGYLSSWPPLLIGVHFYASTSVVCLEFCYLPIYMYITFVDFVL